MKKNTESMTALISTFGRAYHSINNQSKIFDDFLAKDLLYEGEFEEISKHMSSGVSFFRGKEDLDFKNDNDALEWVVQTQIAPTPLARSRYTEDMLDKAIDAGVEQYVILGAGFDTFSHRRPDLTVIIKVYELDHPNTQKSKLDRFHNLGWKYQKNVEYVGVDFTTDKISEKLLDSGFDPNKLTFISWLGVTYYLSKGEINKVLSDMKMVIPKGSSIIFDYGDENMFDNSMNTNRVQSMISLANASGEPMKSNFSYEDLEKTLEDCGLLIYEHMTFGEIGERYFKGRNDHYCAFENINYVLAVKDK